MQASESSPIRDRRSTTELHHQRIAEMPQEVSRYGQEHRWKFLELDLELSLVSRLVNCKWTDFHVEMTQLTL